MYYWLCVLLYTVLAAMKGTQYNVLLVVCTGIILCACALIKTVFISTLLINAHYVQCMYLL